MKKLPKILLAVLSTVGMVTGALVKTPEQASATEMEVKIQGPGEKVYPEFAITKMKPYDNTMSMYYLDRDGSGGKVRRVLLLANKKKYAVRKTMENDFIVNNWELVCGDDGWVVLDKRIGDDEEWLPNGTVIDLTVDDLQAPYFLSAAESTGEFYYSVEIENPDGTWERWIGMLQYAINDAQKRQWEYDDTMGGLMVQIWGTWLYQAGAGAHTMQYPVWEDYQAESNYLGWKEGTERDPEEVVGYGVNLEVLQAGVEAEGKIAVLNEQISELTSQVSTLENRISELEDESEDLEGEIADLNEEISGLEAQVTSLESAKTLSEEQRLTLAREKSALEAELVTVKTELTTTKADLAEARGALATVQGELATTKEALATTQAELAATKEALTATQTALIEAQNKPAEVVKVTKTVEVPVEVEKEVAKEVEKEVIREVPVYRTVTQTVTDETRVKELEEELSGKDARIQELEEELKRKEMELAEKDEELKAAKEALAGKVEVPETYGAERETMYIWVIVTLGAGLLGLIAWWFLPIGKKRRDAQKD